MLQTGSSAAEQDSNPIYRVLVIDDDALAIELVREVLTFENLEIYSTTEAKSGLEMVTQHRPHLVLLDLVMPDVQGIGVARTYFGDRPRRRCHLNDGSLFHGLSGGGYSEGCL